jgi:hypothetical protein
MTTNQSHEYTLLFEFTNRIISCFPVGGGRGNVLIVRLVAYKPYKARTRGIVQKIQNSNVIRVLHASLCDLFLPAHLNGKKTCFTILITAFLPICGPLELM